MREEIVMTACLLSVMTILFGIPFVSVLKDILREEKSK
jgi:hypothetical protein